MDIAKYFELESLAVQRIREFHDGQKYAGQDYTYHLFDVESTVIKRHGYEAYELRIVALLHDILEDTTYDPLDLHKEFGETICNAVLAMTKGFGEDYFSYIERVKSNDLARKVKLCDSFCNLKHSFMEQNQKRIIKYTTVLQLLGGN